MGAHINLAFNTTTAGSIAASNWNTRYDISAAIHSVECNGTEENIFDCQFSYDSSSMCGRYQDASVICQGLTVTLIISTSLACCYRDHTQS